MEHEDPFYKPKPLKLNREAESKPTFDTVKDAPEPAESAPKHFKPIKRKTAFSPSNILGLIIPIVVTAALGYGGYLGFRAFRDITLRADDADRRALAATTEQTSMLAEISRLESESTNLEQSVPRLVETIKNDARLRAVTRYRADIAEAQMKTQQAKDRHESETLKKATDAENLANVKVQEITNTLAAEEKKAEALLKEQQEMLDFLRANNRSQHPTV